MTIQRVLPLSVSRIPGESLLNFHFRDRQLRKPQYSVSADELFWRILKRLARRACQDVTECPPGTIAAHVARLDDLREIFAHVLRHDFKHTPEANLSGTLGNPYTLADWLSVIEHTRKAHRAPAFVNSRDEQIETINRKLDTIAGLLATHPLIEEIISTEGEL